LERAINGVPGMAYMSSVSGNDGTSVINIVFKAGTDPEIAAVNVQNRAASVLDELPEEVIKSGVIVEKVQNSMLLYLNLLSTDQNLDEKFLYNYTDINIVNNSTRVLYRLKMIDKDGSYKYSDVLPVLVECNKIQALAYPNPVQDGKLHVSVTGTNGKTEGALRTIAGQLVKRINIINGTNNIDVAGIANGTYLLTITSANGLDKKIKVMINQ
jgi:hypothetical protein